MEIVEVVGDDPVEREAGGARFSSTTVDGRSSPAR